MIGNKILLDTNIVSALLKGEKTLINKVDKAEVYLCAVVLGELFYGAEYSTQVESNKANIRELMNLYEVLSIDDKTAEIYGSFKASLRKQGTPIPENDIWIAALSQQHQLNLITRDKHFSNITDISILNW
jgi:tRNA(fMet)-specific endonuclease VapC